MRSNAVFTGLSKDSHDSLEEPLDDPEEVWNIVLTRGGHVGKFVASLVREGLCCFGLSCLLCLVSG